MRAAQQAPECAHYTGLYAPATIEHRVHALSWIHRFLDWPDPTDEPKVSDILKGIRRHKLHKEHFTPEQAPALSVANLHAIVAAMDRAFEDNAEQLAQLKHQRQQFTAMSGTPAQRNRIIRAGHRAELNAKRLIRDKAYFLTALYSGLRQSEVCGLKREWLSQHDTALVFTLGAIKNDPLNVRRKYTVLPHTGGPLCPVAALTEWLAVADISAGFVFRGFDRFGEFSKKIKKDTVTGETIGETAVAFSHTSANKLVKHWARQAGITNGEGYSGHSLRASFITLAKEFGISDDKTIRQTHHKNTDILPTYDRPIDALAASPMFAFGESLCRGEGD